MSMPKSATRDSAPKKAEDTKAIAQEEQRLIEKLGTPVVSDEELRMSNVELFLKLRGDCNKLLDDVAGELVRLNVDKDVKVYEPFVMRAIRLYAFEQESGERSVKIQNFAAGRAILALTEEVVKLPSIIMRTNRLRRIGFTDELAWNEYGETTLADMISAAAVENKGSSVSKDEIGMETSKLLSKLQEECNKLLNDEIEHFKELNEHGLDTKPYEMFVRRAKELTLSEAGQGVEAVRVYNLLTARTILNTIQEALHERALTNRLARLRRMGFEESLTI